MRDVHLRVRVPGGDPAVVFENIGDFARYPEVVDVVRSVSVHSTTDTNQVSSDWVVYFRNGLLRWSESDIYDREQRRILFEQTSGDFDVFHGVWSVEKTDVGCDVYFKAEFDFGIPSLAGILEPIASRVLKENVARVLIGITPTIVIVDDAQVAAAIGVEVELRAVA